MSSLGLWRSVRGCLPGCSALAHSLLALPTEQLAVGYLAPGWHQECFVLLTDTKVRKSLPHHLVAGFGSIDFTGSPSPSESFELPVLYSCYLGRKASCDRHTEPFQHPQTLCSSLCSSKMMKKFADFETYSNSAGVPLQGTTSTYHHCQCADQKTMGLGRLVASPRKKYQSWKSEALLHHLGCSATQQNHKICRVLSVHMSWARHTSIYLQ